MFNLIANVAVAAGAHDVGMSLMPASMCVKKEGENPYGLVPALCEGGIVSQITFLVLLIMFIGTLYILFTKLFEQNKAVSYTHLDGYKRQGLPFASSGRSTR